MATNYKEYRIEIIIGKHSKKESRSYLRDSFNYSKTIYKIFKINYSNAYKAFNLMPSQFCILTSLV